MTGKVPLSDGSSYLKFKLKQERHTGEPYVVVSFGSLGSVNIQHMNPDELRELFATVRQLETAYDAAQAARPT
ncbi:hypothetical protein [Methylorubrum salsuginis]|nr:hypothetical protein [Methylorubrum salsuginis]